jgi:hypothetical protein
MKVILHRLENGYMLLVDNVIRATCNDELSKENCNEIFGVVDVDDLAYKHRRVYQDSFEGMNECIMKDAMHQQVGFVAGFSKAMELNKDKLFTVEDIQNILENDEDLIYQTVDEQGNVKFILDEEVLIQSLQQPTEIEVETEMTEDWYDGFKSKPKRDKNDCLILRKK